MRRVLLLVTGIGLLGTAIGCEITTGVCDCVDLPVPCGHHAVVGPHDGPLPSDAVGLAGPGMPGTPVGIGTAPESIRVMPMPDK
jgi:hypothetical protein